MTSYEYSPYGGVAQWILKILSGDSRGNSVAVKGGPPGDGGGGCDSGRRLLLSASFSSSYCWGLSLFYSYASRRRGCLLEGCEQRTERHSWTVSRPAPVGEPLGRCNTYYCILPHVRHKMLCSERTPFGPVHSGAEKLQDGRRRVSESTMLFIATGVCFADISPGTGWFYL
jgi:hypothetical protein